MPGAPLAVAASPRDRIISEAISLLAVNGFEATTMRQLGDAVGLDNSSLYRHFKSKAELVNAAIDQVAADILAVVESEAGGAAPMTLEGLEAVCGAVGLYLFDRQPAARLMTHWIMSLGDSVSAPAQDTTRPHGRLLGRLTSWLDQGMRSGELRKRAMPDAIVILVSLLLIRPATFGHLLHSMERKRTRAVARRAWAQELRDAVRGYFAP